MKTNLIFDFLRDLTENNNKEWFEKNKTRYEIVKKSYHALAADIITAMKKLDPSLEVLEVKNCVFRINKDVRFSKDKSPYKTSLGIILTPYGKKMQLAGYYIHLEDGQCFTGGGLYMPPNDMVKKVRNEITTFPDEFLSIVKNKNFVKTYTDLDKNASFMLSKPPKGIDIHDPIADYTRLKSFTTAKSFANEEIDKESFVSTCANELIQLKEFIHFLNRGLMSDEHGGIM